MNKSTMYCFGYLSLQTTYRDFWVFLRPMRWFTGYTSRVPLYYSFETKKKHMGEIELSLLWKFCAVVKNKYACLKFLLLVCPALWCMQFRCYHVDSTWKVKPEGITCLRITGVRRTLLSLLVITEIIMKLLWTCHDVEVFRWQLSKISLVSPTPEGIKTSVACHGHFLTLQSSSRLWAGFVTFCGAVTEVQCVSGNALHVTLVGCECIDSTNCDSVLTVRTLRWVVRMKRRKRSFSVSFYF